MRRRSSWIVHVFLLVVLFYPFLLRWRLHDGATNIERRIASLGSVLAEDAVEKRERHDGVKNGLDDISRDVDVRISRPPSEESVLGGPGPVPQQHSPTSSSVIPASDERQNRRKPRRYIAQGYVSNEFLDELGAQALEKKFSLLTMENFQKKISTPLILTTDLQTSSVVGGYSPSVVVVGDVLRAKLVQLFPPAWRWDKAKYLVVLRHCVLAYCRLLRERGETYFVGAEDNAGML